MPKTPTGIRGFDEIMGGGIPKGRPTIVCGGPGCGKTMFGVEFLVRGAMEFDEPGVLITFEESFEEMAQNVASLGFDLKGLAAQKKLAMDFVKIEPSEIEETGEYDLEGLFIRLDYAVKSVGAKRVVLDTVEALFSAFSNVAILRAEIRRLFRWLKDRNLTTVLTAERGEGALTRHGLEEYVSDCVILLDHRTRQQISTRRLRVVKYRGSAHGADEYPFLIDEQGFSVLPLSSLALSYKVSEERVPTGIADLDDMLEGKGYFRGSSILISGTAGSGKSSVCAMLADETCRRGERCLYIAFEESPSQLVRNMKSIGTDLEQWLRNGSLALEAWRPTNCGLEMHLLRIHKLIEQHKPDVVILDPVTNLIEGAEREVNSMLMRLLDYLKTKRITACFAALTSAGESQERTTTAISSLIDTWILVRDVELNGERDRCVYVLKSRGMAHSNQVREFIITSNGIRLVPAYVGAGIVLTGSARLVQETLEAAARMASGNETEKKRRESARRRAAIQAQIAVLQADLAGEESEFSELETEETTRQQQMMMDRQEMAAMRRTALPNGHAEAAKGGA
ncbi:MAG TPA: circadian clock protein KaiC [Candidatus Acidoferrales bacterium]|nr:circadian clock protein KaiC [Candidatus Acidoferrales bacterium]